MKIVLLTLSGNADLALERLAAQFPGAPLRVWRERNLKKALWRHEPAPSAGDNLKSSPSRPNDWFGNVDKTLSCCWARWLVRGNQYFSTGTMVGAKNQKPKSCCARLSVWRAILRRVTPRCDVPRANCGSSKQRWNAASTGHRCRGQTASLRGSRTCDLRRPGTQAGGAASHINGFVNAALQLGVQVSLLSNDEIAGLDQRRVPMKIIWPKPIGSTRAASTSITTCIHRTRPVGNSKRNSRTYLFNVTRGLVGPASRLRCVRSGRCFLNTMDRRFGSAGTGTA